MVEAILWAPIVIAVGIGSLATKGSKVPTCKGVVIEADGKRPLAGALVMV